MSVCGGGAQKARWGQGSPARAEQRPREQEEQQLLGRWGWLSPAAVVILALAASVPHALAMPDTRGRSLWREVVSPSPPSSPPPERARRTDVALAQGAQRARARGKFKANALDLPGHWVRSEDPAHPRMRCPVDLKDAHSMNAMPENSFFKDHDSDVRPHLTPVFCSQPPSTPRNPGAPAGDDPIHANSEFS